MTQEADWAYQKYTDEAVAEEKARVATLLKIVEDAPHAGNCHSRSTGPSSTKWACDCFKSEAALAERAEGPAGAPAKLSTR